MGLSMRRLLLASDHQQDTVSHAGASSGWGGGRTAVEAADDGHVRDADAHRHEIRKVQPHEREQPGQQRRDLDQQTTPALSES